MREGTGPLMSKSMRVLIKACAECNSVAVSLRCHATGTDSCSELIDIPFSGDFRQVTIVFHLVNRVLWAAAAVLHCLQRFVLTSGK